MEPLSSIYLGSISNETIPQSLTQSMHAKGPIIASNDGGAPEINRNCITELLFKKLTIQNSV